MTVARTPAREIFTNPDGLFDRLVALLEDGILIANPAAADLPAWEARLQSEPPGPVDATVIPYRAITSVRANRYHDDMNLAHGDHSRSHLKNICFRSAAVRDRALDSLHRRLGGEFRREEVQYGYRRAAGWPLVWAVGLAAFTYLSAGAAAELARGAAVSPRHAGRAEKVLFVAFLRVLGPTGAWIIGALLVLGALAWLAARLRRPPRMVFLTRT
jgi:hypothetical protein